MKDKKAIRTKRNSKWKKKTNHIKEGRKMMEIKEKKKTDDKDDKG